MKRNKGLSSKLFSFFLIVSLISEPVAFAAEDIKPFEFPANKGRELKLSFRLPESTAKVEDSYQAPIRGEESATLFLLQDAHTNESGQLNLARTIDLLFSHEPSLKTVYTEGSDGDASIAFLRPHKTLADRQRIANKYLKKGILHATEYLDLTGERNYGVWGVENFKLYDASVEVYKAVAKNRERFQNYLKKVSSTFDSLSSKFLSPALKSVLDESSKFDKGSLQLTNYFDRLSREASRMGLAVNDLAHLSLLKELKKQEEAINFDLANEQQLAAVQSLTPEDRALLEGASQKAGPSGFGDKEKVGEGYFALLEEKFGRRTTDDGRRMYPELFKYFDYLKLSRKLDAAEVLNELKELRLRVISGLIVSEEDKMFAGISRMIYLYEKLFRLTITPAEYAEYQVMKKEFGMERLAGFLNKKIMEAGTGYDRSLFLEKGYGDMIASSERFYSLTKDRDEHFIRATFAKMKESGESKAVLITGGFHTNNLKELLKDQGVSFVSITPQVLQETNIKRYEELLLGQPLLMPGSLSAATSKLMIAFLRDLLRRGAPEAAGFKEEFPAEAFAAIPAGARVADYTGLPSARIVPFINPSKFSDDVLIFAYAAVTKPEALSSVRSQALNDLRKALSIPSTASVNEIEIAATNAKEAIVKAWNARSGNLIWTVRTGGVGIDAKSVYRELVPVAPMAAAGTRVANHELIKALALDDQIFFGTLYEAFLEMKAGVSQLPMLSIGNNFFPSSMLDKTTRSLLFGRVDYKDLVADPDNAKAARNVWVTNNILDGGLGEAVDRREYKVTTLKLTGQDAKLGAKGTDLYYASADGTLYNVAEIKLRRAMAAASEGLYEHVTYRPIVSADSKPSYEKLFEKYKSAAVQAGLELVPSEDMLVANLVPTITELAPGSFDLTTERQSTGGSHGQWGVYFQNDAARRQLPNDGKGHVQAFMNGDGVNNAPDNVIIGWMHRNRVPVVMITTEKTGLDRKGGIMGLQILNPEVAASPSDANAVVRTQIMELAQAKKVKEQDKFEDVGIAPGFGETGQQDFNTNIAAINESVLGPFLRDLIAVIGEAAFFRAISPDLIQKDVVEVKEVDGHKVEKKFTQLEGALGSSLLNLDAYVTASSDQRIKDLLAKHGLKKIVQVVYVSSEDRSRFFTPIKNSFDFWYQNYSDSYRLNTTTWMLEKTDETKHPPIIEINFDVDKIYKNVQFLIDNFGRASTKDLEHLELTGAVAFKDAVLKGKVVIVNKGTEIFDLTTLSQLPKDAKGNIVIENLRIERSASGQVTITPSTAAQPDASSSAGSRLSPENWKKAEVLEERVGPEAYSIRRVEGGLVYLFNQAAQDLLTAVSRIYDSRVFSPITPNEARVLAAELPNDVELQKSIEQYGRSVRTMVTAVAASYLALADRADALQAQGVVESSAGSRLAFVIANGEVRLVRGEAIVFALRLDDPNFASKFTQVTNRELPFGNSSTRVFRLENGVLKYDLETTYGDDDVEVTSVPQQILLAANPEIVERFFNTNFLPREEQLARLVSLNPTQISMPAAGSRVANVEQVAVNSPNDLQIALASVIGLKPTDTVRDSWFVMVYTDRLDRETTGVVTSFAPATDKQEATIQVNTSRGMLAEPVNRLDIEALALYRITLETNTKYPNAVLSALAENPNALLAAIPATGAQSQATIGYGSRLSELAESVRALATYLENASWIPSRDNRVSLAADVSEFVGTLRAGNAQAAVDLIQYLEAQVRPALGREKTSSPEGYEAAVGRVQAVLEAARPFVLQAGGVTGTRVSPVTMETLKEVIPYSFTNMRYVEGDTEGMLIVRNAGSVREGDRFVISAGRAGAERLTPDMLEAIEGVGTANPVLVFRGASRPLDYAPRSTDARYRGAAITAGSLVGTGAAGARITVERSVTEANPEFRGPGFTSVLTSVVAERFSAARNIVRQGVGAVALSFSDALSRAKNFLVGTALANPGAVTAADGAIVPVLFDIKANALLFGVRMDGKELIVTDLATNQSERLSVLGVQRDEAGEVTQVAVPLSELRTALLQKINAKRMELADLAKINTNMGVLIRVDSTLIGTMGRDAAMDSLLAQAAEKAIKGRDAYFRITFSDGALLARAQDYATQKENELGIKPGTLTRLFDLTGFRPEREANILSINTEPTPDMVNVTVQRGQGDGEGMVNFGLDDAAVMARIGEEMLPQAANIYRSGMDPSVNFDATTFVRVIMGRERNTELRSAYSLLPMIKALLNEALKLANDTIKTVGRSA